MCKLQVNVRSAKWIAWPCRALWAVAGFLLLGVATSWGQTGTFANPLVISNTVGTTNGNSSSAVPVAGSPVIAGTGGGKIVWFKWKSTLTGSINFNTEGSPFDTVLGAYLGTNLATLTLVAANDDVNFPSDLTSSISFPVTQGTTYFIGVDGFQGDSGAFTLSWQESGQSAAGSFYIAQPVAPTVPTPGTPYVATANPQIQLTDYDTEGSAGGKLRVSRATGASGAVLVSYFITNTFFTNVFHTNIYGTNVFTTNYDTNMMVTSFTNTFITNFFTSNVLQAYYGGAFISCPYVSGQQLPGGNQVNVTNFFDGAISNTMISTNINFVTNLLAICANATTSGTNTNASGGLTVSFTNIFCSNLPPVTNIVASAQDGLDYMSGPGSLTFIDYQMGVDLPLTIVGNTAATNNRLILVKLTNAAFAGADVGSGLAHPTIDPLGGIAYVSLLSVNLINDCYQSNNVFNMDGSVFYLEEPTTTNVVLTDGITITVGRGNPVGAASVNYTIGENPATPNLTSDGFALQPGSDYAVPNPPNPALLASMPPQFNLATGTANFGIGVTAVTIPITFSNNGAVRFNTDVHVTLSGATLGLMPAANATILFDNQPAGALDRNHNPDDYQYSTPPHILLPGANNPVYAAAVQPDNRTVFAGDFTGYNTVPRNRIARMNADGSLDTSFLASPNSGADGLIDCLSLETNGSIVIGGAFGSFNGTNRYSIARLLPNGSLDLSFNPGLGVDGVVLATAIQPDGKILIAGSFDSVNSTNRNNIARLNSDGSLDGSFDPGVGPSDSVNCIALQNDGRIVIGGNFTSVDGSNYNYVARLNSDGSLDTNFNTAAGFDNNVFALALEPNHSILAGGSFANVNLISRNSIARLNSDGSLDQSFNPGSGADGYVSVITLQPDGNILIGGIFDQYNGTRRVGIARLLPNGVLDTSFMDTAYNQFAGIIKDYYTQPNNYLNTIALQADGNIIIGGSFYQVGGETNSQRPGFARDGIGPRLNIARLIGGATPGPGDISLDQGSYTADKFGGASYVKLVRSDGALGPASVTFTPNPQPAGPGAAVPGVDYTSTVYNPLWTSTWGGSPATWGFADAYTGTNNNAIDDIVPFDGRVTDLGGAYVNVLDNTNTVGNLLLNLILSQPQSLDIFFLGGENIPLGLTLGATTSAPMTLVDNTLNNGVVSFAAATYSVNENATNATIALIRTNGSSGRITVTASTVSGGTATNGIDYHSVSKVVFFEDGQTSTNFTIPVINNPAVQPDKTLNLALSAPTGGATLGQTSAVLTIINDNFAPGHVGFTATNYTVHETGGTATISVSRNGGSQGTLSITYFTQDGTASNGLNYGAVSNTLSWNAGDVSTKSFTVPLIHDGLVTSNLTASLRLSNPIAGGSPNSQALGLQSNAVLSIINDDFYGRPTFSTSNYSVNNNAGNVTITVDRLGGSAQTITVNYATSNGTGANPAFAGVNYAAVSGTLTFNPGEFSHSFTVPVTLPPAATGNLNFNVLLSGPTPASGPGGGVVLGSPSNSVVNIIDTLSLNEPPGTTDRTINADTSFNGTVYSLQIQSDGRILAGGDFTMADGTPRSRLARLNKDGTLDVKFSSATEGANGSVRDLLIESDGRILAAGLFTSINGVNSPYFARLNLDGGLDSSFNPGSGADNPVYALGETFVGPVTNAANRRILIGGSFVTVEGVTVNGIAQLNNDGSVDPAFNSTGANGTVYALEVCSTNDPVNGGKIVVGGDFTMVDGVPRNHIARLNADGTLDTTFNPGAGPSDSVRAITIQVDGKLVIGGLFTTVNGQSYNHVARLNPNGQLDPLFNPGVGANDAVSVITLQQDLKILLGGQFTQASGVTRGRLTRLNSDGTVDPGINFGTGADNFVAAVQVDANGSIDVGGGFDQFEGEAHPYFARLYGLNEIGSGAVGFPSANFSVVESATNIVIEVERTGGTAGDLTVQFATSDGTATAGTNYLGVTNLLDFPTGETLRSVSIPIIGNNIVDINRTVNLALSNPNGGVLGAQPTAVLTIINTNSGVNFSSLNYTVIKNAINGAAVVTLVRSGSSSGVASVDFSTTTNGTATIPTDYAAVSNTIIFGDGVTTVTASVPIVNNGLTEGNKTIDAILSNPTNTILLAPSEVTITIIDNTQPPGSFAFAAPGFTAAENTTNAVITVLRTNGTVGQVSVTVTATAGTAQAGVNFTPVTTNLSFQDGETSKSFLVPLIFDPQVTGNVTVNLTLSNPSSGTQILAPNPVQLTIQDVNIGVAFAQSAYFANDTNGTLTIAVNRLSSTNGAFTVNYASSNGTALAGRDYSAVSGTLSFASGEVLKTFNLSILRDSNITGNLAFFINLSTPSSPAQLVNPSTTSITVIDTDTGLAFTQATNSALKTDSNIVLSVVRTGSVVGSVSVNYSTQDGTAVGGVNYTPVNGVLNFADGQISNSFTIPILNDNRVDGDLAFSASLLNPTNAQLVPPTGETITIHDTEAGFSFSGPTYSVSKGGVAATITVQRTGYTNSAVSVNFATSDGTAHAPANYMPTNGTLFFTNGVVSQNFTVTVIDDGIAEGNKTVNLNLSSPAGGSTLLNPNAAVLTIIDNHSLILPAGAALTYESGPTNGAIDPGETVTLNLALRDAVGLNTSNLVATLLATNGVTSPSGPQTYGALVTNGPSVSRPFTFTAVGGNGTTISAMLQLQDGSSNLGTATFSFSLGSSTNSFTNLAPIVINEVGTATPYPSPLNVSGVNGTISQLTATVSNLYHQNLSDVSILLMGPTGANTLLMAKIGGDNQVTNVTLTFQDGAPELTGSAPVSGTYEPTQFSTEVPFPASTNGQGLLSKPFGLFLANFTNTNPNGTWSLFVFDDTSLDSGDIFNGWSLNVKTLGVVTPTVDIVTGLTVSPSPSVIASNITYTITVTNAGPSPATGIMLTNSFSFAGITVLSNTASQGSWAAFNSGTGIWTIGNLAMNGTATATVTVVGPASPQLLTNTVSAFATQTEANAGNNTSVVVSSVNAPTADLAVGVSDAPDPVVSGNNLTYTITVTNLGPATAIGVLVTNTLPAGVNFVSVSPAGIATNYAGTVIGSLGNLGEGGVTNFSIVVTPNVGGTITNTVTVGSSVADPLKGNNTASVKTVVQAVQLVIAVSGNNLTFTWPSYAGNYSLQSTPSLTPPVVWTTVSSPPPVLVNGQYTVTLPISGGTLFFQLVAP